MGIIISGSFLFRYLLINEIRNYDISNLFYSFLFSKIYSYFFSLGFYDNFEKMLGDVTFFDCG